MKALLPTNLAALGGVTADSASRYTLMFVRVRLMCDGYIAEATDGRCLVRVTGDYPDDVLAFPGDVPSGPAAPVEVMLDPARFKLAAKRIKRKVPRTCLAHVAVGVTADAVTLIADDLTARHVDTMPLVTDGHWPDTDSVLRKDRFARHDAPRVAPAVLARCLATIDALGVTTAGVVVETRGPEHPLHLSATTTRGQTVTAVVMTLVK